MTSLQSIFSEKQLQMVSDESPTPLYFQLYTILKNCILNGTFSTSSFLPAEHQLADAFSVSRITAKRALNKLANDGLVTRQRGKGSRVIHKYKSKPVQAPLVAMLQEIESMARKTVAEVLDTGVLQPPQKIREEFGIEPGETLLYLARVRARDGLRFGYYTSWTRSLGLPDDPDIFKTTPRLAHFREQGLEMTHVTQTLRAVGAVDGAVKALGVEPGSPLLSLTRRSFKKVGDKEHLIDYLLALYHPERFQYRMDLTI